MLQHLSLGGTSSGAAGQRQGPPPPLKKAIRVYRVAFAPDDVNGPDYRRATIADGGTLCQRKGRRGPARLPRPQRLAHRPPRRRARGEISPEQSEPDRRQQSGRENAGRDPERERQLAERRPVRRAGGDAVDRQREQAADQAADQGEQHRLDQERRMTESGLKPSTSNVAISRVREPTAAIHRVHGAEHGAEPP